MKVFHRPEPGRWAGILQRPTLDLKPLEDRIEHILSEVRNLGDQAVRSFTEQFDGVSLLDLRIPEADYDRAEKELSHDLKAAIRVAHDNIRRFHESQREEQRVVETMPGVRCWRRSVPIEKVGLYVPGGTAPLFSTVLMLGVPAVLAGCREIVCCTPPRKDGSVHPAVLYTARLIGIPKVFRAGGAQAIAAMAYGTSTIPAVHKIFGPGNQYVTAAKQRVQRDGLAIDMPAGPSEVLVCADDQADPVFIAADLLSQAEHGVDSQVVLVTFSAEKVEAVQKALENQVRQLPREDIARRALENSAAIVVENEEQAAALINAYAPEHLILSLADPLPLAERVINAGSVFLGYLTPESVGDYASGTNHTLPTNGFARMYSGVSLDDFVKKITYQQLSPEGLRQLGPSVEIMAAAEELEAHKKAVSLRLNTL